MAAFDDRAEQPAAAFDERLRQEDADLTALQVVRTPTFYVNGKLLEDFGAQQLMNLVKSELPEKAPAR